ncbi:MAG: superoxide dismutase family protein [Ruminococcus sp.]|nr:superoxide dismutase family protein [Ruminococcus sp.]
MRNNFANSRAIACINGGEEAPDLYGKVEFFQKKNGVMVVANIFGLPEKNDSGFFAFHIHEGKNCEGKDFSGTKGHYNPNDKSHPNHSGDLPPLLSVDGNAYLAVLTNRFKLKDIIGRTVVIHSDADDFHSQPAGNAGKKIACGVIHKIK